MAAYFGLENVKVFAVNLLDRQGIVNLRPVRTCIQGEGVDGNISIDEVREVHVQDHPFFLAVVSAFDGSGGKFLELRHQHIGKQVAALHLYIKSKTLKWQVFPYGNGARSKVPFEVLVECRGNVA